MKTFLTLLLLLNILPASSQSEKLDPSRGEFYYINEAYLINGDSIYSMKEDYVDVPSKVFILFSSGQSPDSSLIISIDHGKDRVVLLGFAQELEDPGNFDFLPGKKTFYNWNYQAAGMNEPGECFLIREYIAEMKNLVPEEYYRFHFLFGKVKYMFYCDIPQIHFRPAEK